jgi:FtsZ-binding cell division protein ZapB
MNEDELEIKERDLSIKAGEKQSMVFASKVKAVNSEKGTVDVIMSDASIDRYHEVIDPRAWKKGLANYKKHPVLLSSHNYHGLTNQIGKAETIKVNKDGQLEARMKYFIGKGNPEADWGFFLAEEGVAAYSVGFIPKSYVWSGDGDFDDLAAELGYSKKEAAKIHIIFTEVELLENSHVLVPANPAGLLKGMESEEVQGDALLKSLYTEALEKIDSFKDFFETDGAAAISKSFGIGADDKKNQIGVAGRIKRVKKEDKVVDGAGEVLAAIKALDKDADEDYALAAKKEVGLKELIASLQELDALEDNSEEIAAFWDMAKEKGFSIDDVLAAVEKALESGGPAAPVEKDASDDLPEGGLIADESPINNDGSIEVKEVDDEEEVPVDDPAVGKAVVDTEKGVVEEEMSPEVEAIKDATDSAVEKINAAVKTAIEQFSSLTLESKKTAEKVEAFENDLSAVKTMLTDLEENKIDLKEAEEVTADSMRELLAGIKDATAKISAKEVPSEKG